MILIVNVCAEKLHYFEFVKPIEDIVGGDFVTRHYSELGEEDLVNCDKVIICGTSLADNKFLGDLDKFDWLKDFRKPVLGICAGFQIIGLTFGGKIEAGRSAYPQLRNSGAKTEIGYFRENFDRELFGLKGEVEVYHLHNNFVSGWSDDWEVWGEEIAQAVKHKDREIYGVLFHPEVRNKDLVVQFIRAPRARFDKPKQPARKSREHDLEVRNKDLAREFVKL